MNYILDTNIFVLLEASKRFKIYFNEQFVIAENALLVSVVSEGEFQALMLKRQWSTARMEKALALFQDFVITPIKVQSVIQAYAQIDAYSQGKLSNQPLPTGMSSRNMGKNDLWIAATTWVANAILITTDRDFDHLDGVFFPIERVNIADFKGK